jgi:hypothetical protein
MGVSGQYHTLALLYPTENTPSTHWIAGWVSLTAGLDTEGERKNHLPLLGIEPQSSL